MLKMSSKRRSGKFLKILLIVILIVAVGAASGYGVYRYMQEQNAEQESTSSKNETSSQSDTTSLSETGQSGAIPLDSEPKDISTKAEVGSLESAEPRISSISAIQDSDPKSPTNNKVLIRATVQGSETGTCKLKLTRKGQTTLIADVPLSKQPNYNICQGFDVALTEFPTGGTWNVEVKVEVNGKESAPATLTVQVRK